MRAHLGLTLPDLAHLLDIADATLSRYEDGSETAPQTVTLALLALCLRAHAGQALEGSLDHLGVRFAREERREKAQQDPTVGMPAKLNK